MTELIDCHAHVYRKDLPFAPSAWHRPDHDASHQEFAALLATHEVNSAVLAAASILADENRYAFEAIKNNPTWRTSVIAAPHSTAQTLADWDSKGARGIRLQLMHHPLPDLASEGYKTLFRSIAQLGWHIHVHDHAERLAQSLPLLIDTGARIIVDHFGRPDPETGRDGVGYQAMLKAAETGRLWVKLSAGFRLGSEAFAAQMAAHLIEDFGPERLVWGSDWPFAGFEQTMTYQKARETFEQWVPASMRHQIGTLTPRALYNDAAGISAGEIQR